MTLRSRLFVAILATALVSTVLTVLVAEVLVRQRAQAQALHTLASNAAILAASPLRVTGAAERRHASRLALRNAGSQGAVFALQGGSITHLRPLDRRRASVVLRAIPSASVASGEATIAGRSMLYAASSGKLGRIVLVRSARLGNGDASPFAVAIVLVGALGIAFSALLAWLIARRATQPLRELAALSARLPHLQEPPRIDRPTRAPREILALVDGFDEMARELTAARRAQRDFLLTASHELRSPISAILAHAEGIEDGAVEPGAASAVIVVEARRLERLVRDLLDLARLDRREFEFVRERIALGAVAQTLLERHRARALALGVSLHVVQAEGETHVWADRERVVQAASNLIENALRVSSPGTEIELAVRDGVLAVSDRGPGLSERERERAFERFYLHRQLGEAAHGGAGLGLAIVAELMRGMGGSASVHARAGGGTRFELRLPMARDCGASRAAQPLQRQS